jgi:hypothetical protein
MKEKIEKKNVFKLNYFTNKHSPSENKTFGLFLAAIN